MNNLLKFHIQATQRRSGTFSGSQSYLNEEVGQDTLCLIRVAWFPPWTLITKREGTASALT
jgi:hypothetical protein